MACKWACRWHISGAPHGAATALGRSCGGGAKRHICADAHGNPIDFKITGGEVHDSTVAHQLMDYLKKIIIVSQIRVMTLIQFGTKYETSDI